MLLLYLLLLATYPELHADATNGGYLTYTNTLLELI